MGEAYLSFFELPKPADNAWIHPFIHIQGKSEERAIVGWYSLSCLRYSPIALYETTTYESQS